MSKPTLQIKNLVSLVLAAASSIAWGIFAKRFFDTPPRPALSFAITGSLLLLAQFGLTFVESKEEEELSLIRKERNDRLRHYLEEEASLSERIRVEINAGNLEKVRQWNKFRRDRHG